MLHSNDGQRFDAFLILRTIGSNLFWKLLCEERYMRLWWVWAQKDQTRTPNNLGIVAAMADQREKERVRTGTHGSRWRTRGIIQLRTAHQLLSSIPFIESKRVANSLPQFTCLEPNHSLFRQLNTFISIIAHRSPGYTWFQFQSVNGMNKVNFTCTNWMLLEWKADRTETGDASVNAFEISFCCKNLSEKLIFDAMSAHMDCSQFRMYRFQ